MSKTYLKDGKEIIIKEAKKEDAQAMIDFYNIVGGQTDFLLFGKNEFNRELKDYENYIESTIKEDNSIILVATIDDQIKSIASINSNKKSRTKHVGTLGIVVEEQYCGLGLGRKLIDYLIDWAKSNGITKKISLLTRQDNIRAIELYKKIGFEEEGMLRKDNYIDGVYHNTIMMGLIL